MGPARLELFKFSFYVFFPIAIMLHYGDPDWYETYVKPFKESYTLSQIPQVEPPKDRTELQEQIARLKNERLAKRQGNTTVPSSSSTHPSTGSTSSTTAQVQAQGRGEMLSDLPRSGSGATTLLLSERKRAAISGWGDKREV